MDTTISETASELERLKEVLDREAISDLIHRFGVVLDDQRFDDLQSVFAEDATITTPGGRAQGLDAIVAQATRNHTPELRTQHLVTDLVVDLDGERARARANYLAVFATGSGDPAPSPRFQIGSVYRFELVRTTGGWRLHTMEMLPTWAVGERP
jgi:3-phenylpropionate/cinnamic acid dioxygenase small subunit